MKLFNTLIGFLIIGIFLAGTIVGTQDYYPNEVTEDYSITTKNITKEIIIENCKELNLEDTANCLTSNLNTFYKYRIISDSVHLTFEQLITNGGDCVEWSRLINEMALELGFNSEINKVVLSGKGHSAFHNFVTISNDEGWCLVTTGKEELIRQCF